jgi:hypothetical protein
VRSRPPQLKRDALASRDVEHMCVLRVRGNKFEPAKYLASSKLEPYSVFRAGDPRFASRRNGKVYETSGFMVDVSRGPWNTLAGQAADAIAFLKKHRRTLHHLRSIPEVEDIRLDFRLDLRIDREKVFAQFDYFPPELVSLAGALGFGLEISTYPRDLEQLARRRRKPSGRKRRATLRKPR